MPPPTRAVIAADSPATADAGARVAALGGNAADIVVAAGFAATMAEVLLCSISGSGFAMVAPPGVEPELIDGAHAMPGLDPGRRRDSAALDVAEYRLPYGGGITIRIGRGTVAVPGAPAMLEEAWRRHGRLPWAEVLAPSVELARSGWPASRTMVGYLRQVGPGPYSRQEECLRCFFPDGEHPPEPGSPFRIPGLEATMEQIAREGTRALYEGDLAAAIDREMAGRGGLLSRADLLAYRAEARRPLSIRSRGWTLALNPPPAVGGAALGVLIAWLDRSWPAEAGERDLVLARAQRALLELRSGVVEAPDFDDETARALLEDTGLLPWLPRLSAPGTTQICVATADGGLASVAMSNGYDAGIVIPGTGITCNNALGEPELNPFGFLAQPPGSRIVSNMAPTVARADDGRGLAIGSPGAARITTALAQVWARFAFDGLDPGAAVLAPRLHVEPGRSGDGRSLARAEPGVDASRLLDEFAVDAFPSPDMYFGGVKLALVGPSGDLIGRADPRREGAVRTVG